MVLVHLGEEQAAVHLVEDPGNVVRVEEEAVLLPAQVLQRRIGPEVAVENGGLAVRQVDLRRGVNYLGLIWEYSIGFKMEFILFIYYFYYDLSQKLTLYIEKGLGRLQFALAVPHLALVLAQVAHHGGIDAQASIRTYVGAPHQILHLLEQHAVLVPRGLRVVRILHDAVEEGRLALLDGLVNRWDAD